MVLYLLQCSRIFQKPAILSSSLNLYRIHYTKTIYIKKVTYYTVKIGALISCNYTASHIISIPPPPKKKIIILICKIMKELDMFTIGTPIFRVT